MSAVCEICGKEFKTTQGRRGHKTFVHQLTSFSGKSATPLATEQQLDQLTTRLEKLESITGLKEPSSLDRLLGTDKPITEQLERHTRRLTELSGQLREISQQVKLASSNTDVHNLSRQVAQLNEQVKKHADWLTPNPIALLFGNNSYNRPAFLLDLDRLEAQVRDHQGAINWVRKKFNLVKKGGKV